MSGTGRAAAEFVLAEDERDQLVRWSRGASPRLAVRAQIVLACAEPGVVYERVRRAQLPQVAMAATFARLVALRTQPVLPFLDIVNARLGFAAAKARANCRADS